MRPMLRAVAIPSLRSNFLDKFAFPVNCAACLKKFDSPSEFVKHSKEIHGLSYGTTSASTTDMLDLIGEIWKG